MNADQELIYFGVIQEGRRLGKPCSDHSGQQLGLGEVTQTEPKNRQKRQRL